MRFSAFHYFTKLLNRMMFICIDEPLQWLVNINDMLLEKVLEYGGCTAFGNADLLSWLVFSPITVGCLISIRCL